MKNYEPKSTGVTLLKHGLARAKARLAKNPNIDPATILVSIPMSQAEDIVSARRNELDSLATIVALTDELSFQLNLEYADYKPNQLRALIGKISQKITALKK